MKKYQDTKSYKELAETNSKMVRTKPYKITVLVFYFVLAIISIVGASLLTRNAYFVNYWNTNNYFDFNLPDNFAKPYLGVAILVLCVLWGAVIVLLSMAFWVIRMTFSKDEQKVKGDINKIRIQSIVLLVFMIAAFAHVISLNCIYAARIAPEIQVSFWTLSVGVPVPSYNIAILIMCQLAWMILIPSVIFTTKLRKLEK